MPIKRESKRQQEAYEYWANLPKPSDRLVAEKYRVSEYTARKWRREFGWEDRYKQRKETAKAKTEKLVTDDIAEIRARHAREFIELEGKFFEELQKRIEAGLADEKIRDVYEMLKGSIDGIRQALGLPDQSLEVSGAKPIELEFVESGRKPPVEDDQNETTEDSA